MLDTTGPEMTPASDKSGDGKAISFVFPCASALTVVAIVGCVLLRGDQQGKFWDKAMYVSSWFLVLGVLYIARTRVSDRRSVSIAATCVAITGLSAGMICVEHVAASLIFWEGFGVSVFVGAFLLAPVMWKLMGGAIVRTRPVYWLLTIIAIVVCSFDLPVLLRRSAFEPDASNNSFVLSEILAPSSGRIPGSNFLPQYVNLLGWVLKPFSYLTSAQTMATVAVVFLVVLEFAAIAIGVWVVHLCLGRRSLAISVLLVVPITSVTVDHLMSPGVLDSSLASTLQELPVRDFPCMLLCWLGVALLCRMRRNGTLPMACFGLGAVAGLVAVDEFDFGLASCAALGLTFFVAARPWRKYWSSLLSWFAGVIAGVLAYPAIAAATGNSVSFSNLTYFTRALGNGVFASLVQVPGPVLLVLPVLLATAMSGAYLLLPGRDRIGQDEYLYRLACTAMLFGLWSSFGFLYYLNRSFASSQLQVLLLPFSVCVASVFAMAIKQHANKGTAAGAGVRVVSSRLQLYPYLLLAGLLVATTLQSPLPFPFLTWFAKPQSVPGFSQSLFPFPTLSTLAGVDAAKSLRAYAATHGGGSTGYFGFGGIYVTMATHVPDLSPFDDPSDGIAGPAVIATACAFMRQHATTWLFVYPGALNYATQPIYPLPLCGVYHPVTATGFPVDSVFKLER